MHVQKQTWMVSLLIVESGTETTVKRHSRNCQSAAFELLESVEHCRSTMDELHVLGRPSQSAWSLDNLTIYKSLKSISVYRFTHNYCLHWSVPWDPFSSVDLCKLTRVYFIVTRQIQVFSVHRRSLLAVCKQTGSIHVNSSSTGPNHLRSHVRSII